MLKNKADIFTRLAALCGSGISLREGLHMLAQSEGGRQGRAFQQAIVTLDTGGDLYESLDATKLFDLFELELILAGEQSGRLPEALRALSEECDRRHSATLALLFSMAYPTFLIHAAILLPSLGTIFERGKGFTAYLKLVGTELGWLYGVVFIPTLIFISIRAQPRLRVGLDEALLRLPLLGGYLLRSELARGLRVAGALYASGVNLIRSAEQAGLVTRNLALRALWFRARDRLKGGDNLAASLVPERRLPSLVIDLLTTGERTGQLDTMFQRAALTLEEEAKTALRMLLGLGAGLFFAIAAVTVAYKIISFYLGYFEKINSIR